jgi:hypothetical protein
VEGDGTGDAIVFVYVCNLEFVEHTILLQEVILYLDGLPISLLLGTNAEVESDPLGLGVVAVHARHGYSFGTRDAGSTERASAILRMVRG